MNKLHRLWCNCVDCVRFRGRRVPDAEVERCEARLQQLERLPRILWYGVDVATGPDRTVLDVQRIVREDTLRACGVDAWDLALTPHDLKMLRSFGISPR